MKKIWQFCLVFMVAFIILYPYTPAEAKIDLATDESLMLEGSFTDDLLAAGGMVTGETTVDGDALVVGSSVDIAGIYNDDLNVAGSQVQISGVVKDNLRVAGGSVSISSQVNGNLMVAGGQVTIEKDAVVDGDLYIAGGMIVINGEVKGDVHVSGGQVLVGGKFAGDLLIESEELDVADSALIEGDLSYTAREEIGDLQGKILGKINFEKLTETAGQVGGAVAGVTVMAMIWDFIIGILMLFAVGLVIVLLTPETAEKVVTNFSKNIWLALLYGIIAMIVLPIVGVVLLFTIVGIPLGLILLVLYGVCIYLGVVFAALTVGSLILNRKTTEWSSMLMSLALGVFLLQLIGIVPWVGGLVSFILMTVGFGSIIYSVVHKKGAVINKKLIEENLEDSKKSKVRGKR